MPVVIQIELHGYDAEDRRFQCSGRTVNMSRGGLLAQVDRKVESGTRCLAHFPSAAGRLGRTMVYGVVGRVRETPAGCEVALTFDNPLLQVELPPGAAGEGEP